MFPTRRMSFQQQIPQIKQENGACRNFEKSVAAELHKLAENEDFRGIEVSAKVNNARSRLSINFYFNETFSPCLIGKR